MYYLCRYKLVETKSFLTREEAEAVHAENQSPKDYHVIYKEFGKYCVLENSWRPSYPRTLEIKSAED